METPPNGHGASNIEFLRNHQKNKKIYGNELLFRNGLSNAFPDIDGDTATSKLLRLERP